MTCKTCGSNITGGPKPYYEEVKESVVQNHETVVNHTIHAVGVRVLDPWNIPQKGESVTVAIESISVVPLGSYLFHPSYGYYLISSWNPKTQQISITNDGIVGNTGEGSFVPARTPFLVSPKPCCQGEQGTFFPFLAEDFDAPFINQSASIDVTSTFGLGVGDFIRIGEAVYRLDVIQSTKRIQIFNTGSGFAPGTSVEAQDTNGEYKYLITVESSFVCVTGAETAAGRLIVCHEGDQKIITGAALGQVPMLVDVTTGEVEFQSIGVSAIIDGSVTTPKLANGAVTAAKLGADSVGAVHIAAGAVGNSELAANSVATTNILDQHITTAKIADGNVTGIKLANLVVTTDKIADGNVTAAKLASNSVITSKLALQSVIPDIIASLSAGQTYIPTLLGPSSSVLTITTLTGRYWQLGPLVLCTIKGSAQVSVGEATPSIRLSLPLPAMNIAASEYWPSIPSFPSEVLETYVFIEGDTGTSEFLQYTKTSDVTAGQLITPRCFFIYATR